MDSPSSRLTKKSVDGLLIYLDGGYVWFLGGHGIVAGDGSHGHVVEEREKHDEERADHVVVDEDDQG